MNEQNSLDVLAPDERVTGERLSKWRQSRVRLGHTRAGRPLSGGLMLAGSALIVALLAVLVWWDFRPQPQVAVPNLIGMSRAAAEAQLTRSGLALRSASTQISDQPAGTVLRTDPAAGAMLDQVRGVSLVLAVSGPPPMPAPATEQSPAVVPPQVVQPPAAVAQPPAVVTHPPAVLVPPLVLVPPPVVVVVPPPVAASPAPVLQRVPYLVGLDRPSAERVLDEHGLRIGSITVAASDLPAGTVLRTDPRPGTSVGAGSVVDLVFAESHQVLVADVVGFDRVRAERVLSEQGLRVGTVTEEVSEQRAHTVLRTSPSADTAVLPGRAVDLVLAKASVSTKRIPNVVGLGRSAAEWMLVANGLKVGSVTEEESSKSPNSVLRSDPAAGTEVQPGNTVDLVVAKAPSAGSQDSGNDNGGGTGTTAVAPKGIRKDG